MTADDAIKFAASLAQQGPHRPFTCPGEIEVLRAIARNASPALIARTRRQLLEQATAFQRVDSPGHDTWYRSHLEAAAYICQHYPRTD